VAQAWEEPVVTSLGPVRWQQVSDPIGRKLCYLIVTAFGTPPEYLVGYMTVDDPATVDEETRRPLDPVDRRVDTVWVHPAARGHGIARALGLVAREAGLFESHSHTRTAAGTAWAKALGDALPPPEEQPDPQEFDQGARRYYCALLAANPGLVEPTDQLP
jgi:GNAT superfamily N-acetyltransferase